MEKTKVYRSDIHGLISSAYANAVSGQGNNNETMPKGQDAIIDTAGYSVAELSISENTDNYTFACGNPVAMALINPGDTVVDLGCGTGLDLILAAEVTGSKGTVIGVDMTDEMLVLAQKRIDQTDFENIVLKKSYIEDLPFESNTIDKIISNCVINLSPEKEQVMSEMYRVLKDGGSISVSDIVIEDIPRWLLNQASLYATCVAGAITIDKYLDLLVQTGFKSIEIIGHKKYSEQEILAILDLEVESLKSGLGDMFFKTLLNKVTGKIHSIHLQATK
ncbi:methyltransferase domain-containing protein [Psychromonas sp. Urea-02u-13]|uniref:methyltransferase domain-containing protein n=1 Tax=Psychromonas sp. Urea-02u-13 TaxID=2058326 RepID=UPI000C31DE82|nr:methyltransferase domain-containing protein [Psychromonas sp. Urea-02u-13]PKG37879.1 arsenite S-adenosylmethyltransferase [Psychromonas sp. Urea-02u-13]